MATSGTEHICYVDVTTKAGREENAVPWMDAQKVE